MILKFNTKIKEGFPAFFIGMVELYDVSNVPSLPLKPFRDSIINEIKSKYNLEKLKDILTVRVNRDFFWKIGIDPTKKRPAAEALIRRILHDKEIPEIIIFVDLYNLISIKHEIAIAGFDMDKISEDILMRHAKNYEEFIGIGMKKPVILTGKEIILVDNNNIIAIYPYRDADLSKLTKKTKKIVLLTCGVPRFPYNKVYDATKDLYDVFNKYLDAKGDFKVFESVTHID